MHPSGFDPGLIDNDRLNADLLHLLVDLSEVFGHQLWEGFSAIVRGDRTRESFAGCNIELRAVQCIAQVRIVPLSVPISRGAFI